MADVKWIKIVTDLFDDEKILMIETLPEADSIIVIWFKLICLAGKQNNSGVFLFNGKVPYTLNMFTTIFRRKELVVELALKTFENFGMIEIIENVVTIPNWAKHQNLDRIESQNKYHKEYMQVYRKKQRLIATGEACEVNSEVNSKSNSKRNVTVLELDKNYIKKNEKENKDYQLIADMYNEVCTSLPSVSTLSEARKKALKARLNSYTVVDFKKLFKAAEESDFLKGKGTKDWMANFDWLIKDANMAKVLDGNYKNKGGDNDAYDDYIPCRPDACL